MRKKDFDHGRIRTSKSNTYVGCSENPISLLKLKHRALIKTKGSILVYTQEARFFRSRFSKLQAQKLGFDHLLRDMLETLAGELTDITFSEDCL